MNKQCIYQSCERIDAVVKHVVRSNSHLQAEPVHTRWAMIGNAWRKRRWSRHRVDALASMLMCKRMTNDQVNWHAKKNSEANAEQISANEAKLIMTSMDAMLTLTNVPQMKCVYPHQNDVKLHTCGKMTGFQTETTHRCHSVFFESENRHHCRETEQHVFKNIGCN